MPLDKKETWGSYLISVMGIVNVDLVQQVPRLGQDLTDNA